MKHKLVCTLGLIVLVMVAFVTGPANAQTTANGPYYATPSWDQTLACTTTANCPRFIVLSNMSSAAVLDRETGLVWERSPSTSAFLWLDAQHHCNNLTVGNRKGWRLPTIQELASLVDPSVAPPGPTLPAGHPFDTDCSTGGCVQSDRYWSATTTVNNPNVAWIVHFRNGDVAGDFKSGGNFDVFVWCVRGGQGVDPQ